MDGRRGESIMRRILGIIVAATCFAFGCVTSSGDGAESSDDECDPGEPCVCDSTGSCSRSCSGSGCDFECNGTGSCSFQCDDGGCDARGNGQGSVSLSC